MLCDLNLNEIYVSQSHSLYVLLLVSIITICINCIIASCNTAELGKLLATSSFLFWFGFF